VTQQEILEKLKDMLVTRLRFDPQRAAAVTLDTTLPKSVEGSLGLDSLDILELVFAIEEQFRIVIDEREDLAADFFSLDSLSRFVLTKTGQA
jgi:acyl carrier protein